jgi:hypothetical protein
MNAKQIFEQLLAGKKVGQSPTYYVYLNIDGNLMSESEGWAAEPGEVLSDILVFDTTKVIPEEGP